MRIREKQDLIEFYIKSETLSESQKISLITNLIAEVDKKLLGVEQDLKYLNNEKNALKMENNALKKELSSK